MFVDVSKDVVLKDINGTFYLIKCEYFVPYKTLNVYEVYTVEQQDKIRCGKGEGKRVKGYYERNVTKCLACCVRHGYVVATARTIEVVKRR